MIKKTRLDLFLQEKGFLPNRQVAQTVIMDGSVLVNGLKITKPGTLVKNDVKIELVGNWQGQKYVSRGGLKLEKALNEFAVNVEGRICLDVGASSGGFTDCLLKHGARQVFAIDVGYGQIDWSLRTNQQVVVKERINARYMTPEVIYERQYLDTKATLAVIDVSFISIKKLLHAVLCCLAEQKAEIIALIKPQFEAGPASVGKGGIVRSQAVHIQVIEEVILAAQKLGLVTCALTFSPLRGAKGNLEFLTHWLPDGTKGSIDRARIETVVYEAHKL